MELRDCHAKGRLIMFEGIGAFEIVVVALILGMYWMARDMHRERRLDAAQGRCRAYEHKERAGQVTLSTRPALTRSRFNYTS